MDIALYPALAARTEKPLPTAFDRMAHASLGITTEVGEIVTTIKRIAIYGKTLADFEKDGKTTLRMALAEEIGDVLWYLAIIDNVHDYGVFAAGLPPVSDRAGKYEPLAALDSIARRLVIRAGRIAYALECEFIRISDDLAVDFKQEVSGILSDLVDLAALINVDVTGIATQNIAKLQARYPEAYSDVAAEARADKGGLDARNS